MIVIRDWFNYDENTQMFIVKDGDTIYRFFKSFFKLSKEIIIGETMSHSEHYLTPQLMYSKDNEHIHLVESYNGRTFISDGETAFYEDDMIEAHKDALKAGLKPMFGYDDIMIDDKDNLVVVNLKKFDLEV